MVWNKPRWSLVLAVLLCWSGSIAVTTGLITPPLLTSGVLGVFNKSKLEASWFRNSSAKAFFRVWPEDFPGSRFYCEDYTGIYSLANFTSAPGENIIDSRPYFDVGIVDDYMSFLGINEHFWILDTNRITYPVRCEYKDLQKLYLHRLHHRVPWTSAIWSSIYTAMFELIAIASTAVFWILPGFVIADPDEEPDVEMVAILEPEPDSGAAHEAEPDELVAGPETEPQPQPQPQPVLLLGRRTVAWKWIVLMSFKDNLADILHVDLLISVSILMIELVGHSDARGWRATIFYNLTVLYKQIAICAFVAALLRQICLAWPSDSVREKLRDFELELCRYYVDRKFHWWEYCKKSMRKLNDDPATFASISADWRWQRIFGQGAVILLTGTLVASVEDDSGTSLDSLASLVLATVVVASIWSLGVTGVSLFRSFFFLLGKALGNR